MKIERLSKKIITENIDQLRKIDSFIMDEPWLENNFLIDFEGKWDYSLYAIDNDEIVAFIICSLKTEENLHIHRFATLPKYQRKGIGTLLIAHLLANISNSGIKYITVRTKIMNLLAQRFYEKKGFKNMGTDRSDCIYKKVIK